MARKMNAADVAAAVASVTPEQKPGVQSALANLDLSASFIKPGSEAAGLVGGLTDARSAAILTSRNNLLELFPTNMRDDIASGACTMDHTAALAGIVARSDLPKILYYPKGVLNIDRHHVPANSPVQVWDFGDCELRLRSDYTTGLGHFVRFINTGGYGSLDNKRVLGGYINQSNKQMQGHLFVAEWTRNLQVEHTRIRHRDTGLALFTLNTSSDTWTVTNSGTHSIPENAKVSMTGGGTWGKFQITTAMTFYVLVQSSTTFKLGTVPSALAMSLSAGTGSLTVGGVPVTLDDTTGLFTSASPHGLGNGQAVQMTSTGALPTTTLSSGAHVFSRNVTSNTLQTSLTPSGPIMDWVTAPTNTMMIGLIGSWAMSVGGRGLRLVQTRVENGNGIYQDGHHVTHGDDIALIGCHSEAGDDAFPFGTDAAFLMPDGKPEGISNASLDGCYGDSHSAFLFKVYKNLSDVNVGGVNYPYKVRGVHANSLKGKAGRYSNGAVGIYDTTGTDARTKSYKDTPIAGIRVTDMDVVVGSPERDATAASNPYHVQLQGVRDVRVDGKFVSDTAAIQEYLVVQSVDCHVKMRTGYLDGVPRLVPGVISTSAGFGCWGCTATADPIDNKAAASVGFLGMIEGTNVGPSNWSYAPQTNAGVTRNWAVGGAGRDNLPTALLNFNGTATAAFDWSFGTYVTVTDVPALKDQTRRAKIDIALVRPLINLGCTLWLDERNSSGALLGTTQKVIASRLSGDFGTFFVERTMSDPTAAFCTFRVVLTQGASGLVDGQIAISNPRWD